VSWFHLFLLQIKIVFHQYEIRSYFNQIFTITLLFREKRSIYLKLEFRTKLNICDVIIVYLLEMGILQSPLGIMERVVINKKSKVNEFSNNRIVYKSWCTIFFFDPFCLFDVSKPNKCAYTLRTRRTFRVSPREFTVCTFDYYSVDYIFFFFLVRSFSFWRVKKTFMSTYI